MWLARSEVELLFKVHCSELQGVFVALIFLKAPRQRRLRVWSFSLLSFLLASFQKKNSSAETSITLWLKTGVPKWECVWLAGILHTKLSLTFWVGWHYLLLCWNKETKKTKSVDYFKVVHHVTIHKINRLHCFCCATYLYQFVTRWNQIQRVYSSFYCPQWCICSHSAIPLTCV